MRQKFAKCMYHDRLALVLNDVTRSSDLVSTTQGEKHELIRGVNRLLNFRGRGLVFSFGRHVCSIDTVAPDGGVRVF